MGTSEGGVEISFDGPWYWIAPNDVRIAFDIVHTK